MEYLLYYIIHYAPQKCLPFKIGTDGLLLFNYFAGALVVVFTQRFVITRADLFVYHYMETNPEKFPSNVIDNIRNYMIQVGHLKEDTADRMCKIGKVECKNSFVCW